MGQGYKVGSIFEASVLTVSHILILGEPFYYNQNTNKGGELIKKMYFTSFLKFTTENRANTTKKPLVIE